LFRARRHAGSVAARVAALLGLFQLGRAARRLSQAGQIVLVAVTVPVAFAILPSSSAMATPHLNPPQGGREISSYPGPNGEREMLRPGPTLRGGRVLDVSSVPVSLPAVPLEGAMSTVNNAISTLWNRTPRPDPPQGGTVIESGQLPTLTLPRKVGGL
jgi:hypothetical protein